MQHEITKVAPLLDGNGHLGEPGFAKSLLPIYNRSAIKAPGWRIKGGEVLATVPSVITLLDLGLDTEVKALSNSEPRLVKKLL